MCMRLHRSSLRRKRPEEHHSRVTLVWSGGSAGRAHGREGRGPLYPAAIEAPSPVDATMADVAAGRVGETDEYVYWAN